MVPLSAGGEALTCSTLVGKSNFAQWVDGTTTAYFDPLLRMGDGI